MDEKIENGGKALLKKKPVDKDKIFYWLFLAFPLLQFCIFYIGVNLNSFSLSFKQFDADKGFVKAQDFWQNFKRIWAELTDSSLLRDALANSLTVWIFSTLFGTVIAVIFSYYIYKKRIMSGSFRFVLFLPSVLPAVLMAVMFMFFMDETIPVLIGQFTGNQPDPIMATPTVRFVMTVFYTVWIGFGTQVLLYTGSMEQIDPSVIEAGELDGTTPMTELLYVVFPAILPTIETFLVAGVAAIFTNQANLYNFFGTDSAPEDYTIGYYLFILVNKSDFGTEYYPYASALGLACTALALPLTYAMKKLLAKVRGE